MQPAANPLNAGIQPLLRMASMRKSFPLPSRDAEGRREVVRAVDHVDITVYPGETLAIVGESGCGKSTTARLMSRLTEPDDGSLLLEERPVGGRGGPSMREYGQAVQMVFQESHASLNPRLTLEQAISFGLRVNGMPARQASARACEMLDKVGLAPSLYAHRFPHELSGGQRQRVNIARALAMRPRLVILDESVSALDKSVEAQILNLLQDLKKELGLTYVFITHDLHVVEHVADRVAVMYLGRIVECGPTAELFAHPRHPYTRALLDSRLSMDPGQRIAAAPLIGDPPNPVNPPPGCRFAPRCAHGTTHCAGTVPHLAADSEDQAHVVACHFPLGTVQSIPALHRDV